MYLVFTLLLRFNIINCTLDIPNNKEETVYLVMDNYTLDIPTSKEEKIQLTNNNLQDIKIKKSSTTLDKERQQEKSFDQYKLLKYIISYLIFACIITTFLSLFISILFNLEFLSVAKVMFGILIVAFIIILYTGIFTFF